MLHITSTYSENVGVNKRLSLNLVSAFTITNYGDTTVFVTIDNHKEEIPPYDATNQYARSYVFGGDGTFSDVRLTIDFAGGSGRALVRARLYSRSIAPTMANNETC